MILKNYIDDFKSHPILLLLFLISFGFIYIVVRFLYRFIRKNNPELERKQNIVKFIDKNRSLIKNNRIEIIINNLLEFNLVRNEKYIHDQVFQISNRYKNLIKDENISSESKDIERNRIVLALINILDEIKNS